MISRILPKVKEVLRRKLGFPMQEFALAQLHRTGFRPRALFDVGASHGVFVDEARRVWPDVEVHCFEPEPEYVRVLQARAAHDAKLRVCPVLVGPERRTKQTYFHHMGASTVLLEHKAEDAPPVPAGPEREASMITLDNYSRQVNVAPDFLKMDVQGYELEVLKGAERILAGVEVVLTEVNHIDIYDRAPLAADMIGWLQAHGFALHDICNLTRRPVDHALWQSDMVFVRHSSAIRRVKTWA